jgi:hypothetical protein
VKSGILSDNEGYDIIINGVWRTFRDVKATAYSAARMAKAHDMNDKVEIIDRSTGQRIEMWADGRTA